MGHFKTKKKSLPKGRTRSTQLGTFENHFLESPTRVILNAKKNTRLNKRVKSYPILKNTTILFPNPL